MELEASALLADKISKALDDPAFRDGDIDIQFPTRRELIWAWYVQDKWQVSPKLTIDAGLRWEMEMASNIKSEMDVKLGNAINIDVTLDQTMGDAKVKLVFLDACRLAQMGGWTGSLRIGERTWDITPERWWGSRDRSWGIRPSGEPEPPGLAATLPFAGFRWVYAPIRLADQSVFLICQERNDGSRVLEEAVRVWRRPSGEGIEHLGRPELDLTWDDDHRFVTAATLSAGKVQVEATPRTAMHLGVGTGYGFDAEWRSGQYHGDLVVQERTWDLRTDEGRAAMWGIVDSSCRYTVDGEEGHGLFEYMFL